MNILITSAGRRVKIIQYFKHAFQNNGKVIAADCDYKAPALYFADSFEFIPRIDDENYLEEVIKVCQKHNIQAVISLLDPELDILIKHHEKFIENDIQLILSPADMIEMSFDKQKTYDELTKLNVPAVPTFDKKLDFLKFIEKKEYSYPAIIKPAKGSASLGLYKIHNEEELNQVFQENEGLIIQPFYLDKEFGVDVYVDLISGELIDIFIKEKLLMRSGETDKSVSVHNDMIENLVIDFIKKTNYRGPIDIDCFEYEEKYYISEINPRFGGGYPHAYELGCDYMNYILKNLNGNENTQYKTYNYKPGLIMMKYDDIKIIQE